MKQVDYSNYAYGTSNNIEYLVNPETGRIAIFRSIKDLRDAMLSCKDFKSSIKHNLFIEANRLKEMISETKHIIETSELQEFYKIREDSSYNDTMPYDSFLELLKMYDKYRFLVDEQDYLLDKLIYEPLVIDSDNIVTLENIEDTDNDCMYELASNAETSTHTRIYYAGIKDKMPEPRVQTVRAFFFIEYKFVQYMEAINVYRQNINSKYRNEALRDIKAYETYAGMNLAQFITSSYIEYKDYKPKGLKV